ncbi:acetyl-CoA carboxylase biotin carboxylase subunit [Streptosporangium becharense]|uniref:biotin carboxylase n=1 Tax=Streptosporangium becharense TaxID=1816182 RepID=A0A7W9MJX9_9ACTN|nr:acetyl-CoA carboxylase biotin carboxylase subunit [Streptosporangium becharense]MBB2910423.1 acetyl-CoA carboxylase biotin carboxylase subunit [Streptosporangium becharense]MBB5823166.1 acetyl-CoA carboxylase biotin carboxylase subunit [Streptosporangium becharense]
MFRTVLIANRGEIALRVARACRELGIRVAAVYSTDDRDSEITRYADQAIHIGPGPVRRSYLNLAAIAEAARMSGADAIHPGYGLLSEDPDLAEVCEDLGVTFVGPPPDVMRRLGDKAAARALMRGAGLPVLPGSDEPDADPRRAADLAAAVGYPVIIKAAAGGGGRGMCVVRDPGDFDRAFRETTASAQALLGDGRVYVERYLESVRHVEVQVLCDRYGNGIHLGERDCSVQRRHQKILEEAPAPGLPRELLDRLNRAAVTGALAAGYVGAGTLEFLVDPEHRFHFMEMNCRIQVEHPVTEMLTGVDLVHEQLRIAAGEPLSLRQEDVVPRGAAIECRINAEDPERGFAPAPGTLTEFDLPAGPFVRVDTHCRPGYRVPPAYDSLLAKVVVWAPDRDRAMARMRRALAEFHAAGPGVHTTTEFLRSVLDHPAFTGAEHDTSVVAGILASRSSGHPG